MTSHRNQNKNPGDSTPMMSPHAASWLAWSLWTLSLALTVVSLILLVLNRLQPNVHIFDYWAEYTVTAVSGSTVGAVIISQRTHNLIGWIFCMGGGLSAGIEHFAAQYATYALRATPDVLPGGPAARLGLPPGCGPSLSVSSCSCASFSPTADRPAHAGGGSHGLAGSCSWQEQY